MAKKEAIRQAMLKPQPPEIMASLAAGRLPKRTFTKCYVCGERLFALGLCSNHYQRVSKRGAINVHKPIGDKSGKHNPKWRGGVIHDKCKNRVLIYAPNHPNPSTYGTHVYRYRLVAEQMLGRFLRKGEIVHHKNGITNDDRPENLEVMTQSKHIKMHLPEMLKMQKEKRRL